MNAVCHKHDELEALNGDS